METDQFEIQKQMLELAIKSGRRMMHDFNHMLSELPETSPFKKEFEERAKHWQAIFYPDNGMKNYLTDLHYEIRSLSGKLEIANNKLRKNGIAP